MTNIDIAKELRDRGWITIILKCGSLSATHGNMVLMRKPDLLRIVIQQKKIITVDYSSKRQPSNIKEFIGWLFEELAGLISFSLATTRKNTNDN